MKQPVFTGSGVAIITPFTNDGVDYTALADLLEFQLQNGTDAIIVCGTTGEAATMSPMERVRTIQTVVDKVGGRVPVIAGTRVQLHGERHFTVQGGGGGWSRWCAGGHPLLQ